MSAPSGPGGHRRGPFRSAGSWRAALRLARRDAGRHVTRTVLATLLIAVPVAALVAFAGLTGSGTPSRERALSTIPHGAQAVVTATTISGEASPFPQLPEGAPGPWVDDPEVTAVDDDEVAGLLTPGSRLLEYWLSPELIVSTGLGLAPGETRAAGEGIELLPGIDLAQLGTGVLHEAVPEALPLLAPDPAQGRLPRASGELLVSDALAGRFGLAVGDTVALLAPPDNGWRSNAGNTMAAMQDSERGFRVVGIAPGPRAEAWSVAGWLSELVAERPEGIQRHWLVVGDEPLTWAQARALNAHQAFAVSRHVLTHYPDARDLYPVPPDSGAYVEWAIGVVATGVLGALLVLFLVTPAFAVSAEQSRRMLGLAAAAGAAPRDVRRIVLAQGVVLGAAGGVLGALAGLAAAWGMAAWLESMSQTATGWSEDYSVASMLAHFPWWMLGAGVVLAVGLGSLAALPPARTAARMAPVDALRDRRPQRGRPGWGRRLLTAAGGPALLLIAVALGGAVFGIPLGESPRTGAMVPPGTLPPEAAALSALIVLALLLAAAGIVLSVRGVLAWFGARGRRVRPVLRLAMRDAADHPSRTAPAALGVLFAVAAAAYLVTSAASGVAAERDRGDSLEWRGSVMAAPRTPVSGAFDRLVVSAAADEAARRFPQLVGNAVVTAPSRRSSVDLQPLLPEGADCTGGIAGVHTASAITPGAPLRCVDPNSRAAFNPMFRFGGMGVWSNTMLFDGAALRATRIEGAEEAARVLDVGGVVVNNAALIDDDGLVRIEVAPLDVLFGPDHVPERVVLLPGHYLRGAGAPFLIAPETARRLGVDDVDLVGVVAAADAPLSQSELRQLYDDEQLSALVTWTTPDDPGPLGTSPDMRATWVTTLPILLLALVAVAATAVSVLLSATQGRRDAVTMTAVGAGRGVLARLSLARASIILALGVPTGVAAGVGLGAYQVAWNRHLEASGAWLSTVPAWGIQAVIVLGVVVAGLGAALLFGRPPRELVGHRLD